MTWWHAWSGNRSGRPLGFMALVGERREWFNRVLALLVPRARRLGDFAPQLVPFLGFVGASDQAAVDKHLKAPGLAQHVRALADSLPLARAV